MAARSNTSCGSFEMAACHLFNSSTCLQEPRSTFPQLVLKTCDSTLARIPHTTLLLARLEEESKQQLGMMVGEMVEDVDGCFYMNPFRETEEYKAYQNFSFIIGLLTIGQVGAYMETHKII